jgi:hypothetical protein
MSNGFAVPYATFFVASLLVCTYAINRFNTPPIVRSQTSRFQYFGSCAIYTVSCLGLLALLSWLVWQKPDFIAFLHAGSSQPIPENVDRMEAPLVIALALTTMLPTFPLLRDVDAKMLRLFHKMGAIPFSAVRWSQRMEAAQFAISDDLLAEVKRYITNRSDLPDTLIEELEPDISVDRTRFRVTRNLVLYVQLKNLKHWASFDHDFPEDTAAFEKKMFNFFTQCIGFFFNSPGRPRKELGALVDGDLRSFALQAYEDIRLMLARVLLYSCNSDAEVANKASRMGFAIERSRPIKIPANRLALVGVVVIALFVASSILLTGQVGVGKAIAIGLLVAINHSIAAVCALVPKQIWCNADIRAANERPFLAYIFSALLAFTISLPVSFGFWLLRHHLPIETGPILPFAAQCKWLLLSTVLAAAIAFVCDDFARTDREPMWLTYVESIGLAGFMAIIGLLVIFWLRDDLATLLPERVNAFTPWIPVMLSASIGALFGATIPKWYRQALRCESRSS